MYLPQLLIGGIKVSYLCEETTSDFRDTRRRCRKAVRAKPHSRISNAGDARHEAGTKNPQYSMLKLFTLKYEERGESLNDAVMSNFLYDKEVLRWESHLFKRKSVCLTKRYIPAASGRVENLEGCGGLFTRCRTHLPIGHTSQCHALSPRFPLTQTNSRSL